MDKELQRYCGGSYDRAYDYFGAHPTKDGWLFRVWAPHARHVALAGDFNGWQGEDMVCRDGVWSLEIRNAAQYDAYKYIVTAEDGRSVWKTDPYAFHTQTRPETSGKLYDIGGYKWHDAAWRRQKAQHPPVEGMLNIYEVHIGSWRR